MSREGPQPGFPRLVSIVAEQKSRTSTAAPMPVSDTGAKPVVLLGASAAKQVISSAYRCIHARGLESGLPHRRRLVVSRGPPAAKAATALLKLRLPACLLARCP